MALLTDDNIGLVQIAGAVFHCYLRNVVLGMDILKQVIMITNPYNQKVYFCKDAEDYEEKFQLKV